MSIICEGKGNEVRYRYLKGTENSYSKDVEKFFYRLCDVNSLSAKESYIQRNSFKITVTNDCTGMENGNLLIIV